MPNYLIEIRYDGKNFCGYQIQLKQNKEDRTVGSEIRRAILSVFGAAERIAGCSRTDAGVHALSYYTSFCSERTLLPEDTIRALNAKLPRDIAVLSCRYVPDGFHARYSVVSKEYIYKIYSAAVRNPFYEGYKLYYPRKIDAETLDRAAKDFIGTHDFCAFMASGSKIEKTVRTVFSADFIKTSDDTYEFKISADGFLYNMVRIMTGTLLDIDAGKIGAEKIPEIIAGKDRNQAGKTAPPNGLYLNKITY